MSVVVVEGSDDEPSAEAVAEVATEVAEAVAEAITEAVEAIAETQSDDSTNADIAFAAGVAIAETAHLQEEVAELQERVEEAETQAEIATDIAVAALSTPDEPAEEVHGEESPPDDEPPATRKSKFNRWFFGEHRFQ